MLGSDERHIGATVQSGQLTTNVQNKFNPIILSIYDWQLKKKQRKRWTRIPHLQRKIREAVLGKKRRIHGKG